MPCFTSPRLGYHSNEILKAILDASDNYVRNFYPKHSHKDLHAEGAVYESLVLNSCYCKVMRRYVNRKSVPASKWITGLI